MSQTRGSLLATLNSMLGRWRSPTHRVPSLGAVRAKGVRPGRNIIRGTSGRAYDFEAYDVASVEDLSETSAVYIYARNLSAAAAHAQNRDATVEDYQIGYIGAAADLAATAEAHAETRAFAGHDFDVVLVVRVDNPRIRNEIMEDILALHRPVLNDLLRSNERAERVG